VALSFDADWDRERERLAGIERLWDHGTKELLQRVGVGVHGGEVEVRDDDVAGWR
jgi:hypothetical protein